MVEIAVADHGQAAALACRLFVDLFSRKTNAVIGLATGSSPMEIYRMLGELAASNLLPDLSGISAFALDEYVGLPAGHAESYRAVLTREWTARLGLREDQLHVPSGDDSQLESAAKAFETALAGSGGVDLQLLGIGSNGHIAFNEPGGPLSSRTHVTSLSEQTRLDNARFFGSLDEVPARSMTQGLQTILEAERILLLAFGEQKAQAIAGAFEGPITRDLPASVLQTHPNVTVLVDEAAASAFSRLPLNSAKSWPLQDA